MCPAVVNENINKTGRFFAADGDGMPRKSQIVCLAHNSTRSIKKEFLLTQCAGPSAEF